MASNLCAKGLAAIAQLYAIFVFTRMQTQEEAALIFLLLGYAIWFQIFEFGLAQTLQNKFNSKVINSNDVLKTILVHYIFLLFLAAFIVFTPYLSDVLLPKAKRSSDDYGVFAFTIGAAILVVASNNVLIQRFLLVINKGFFGNLLLLFQSLASLTGLTIYNYYGQSNAVVAVLVYLGPQVVVSIPVLLRFFFILKSAQTKKSKMRTGMIFYESLGFCGIGILSAAFLGSDYYFAAHYLDSEEVTSYYLVTRIYFISFVVYYAYLLHRVKRLSILSLLNNSVGVFTTMKDAMLVGFFCVVLVFFSAVLLEQWGIFKLMTNGLGASQILLFWGFMYFLVRVIRDVVVVVASSLNKKNILYKIYLLEIFVSLVIMYFLTPTYRGIGIFLSMMIACLIGILYFIWHIKKSKNTDRLAV
ncbi:hypothetical protein G6699_09180 [Polynucleobacter paneuropaeus]|jgi:O-antigen/teichoic acid export membrane protein|nr:hypothetical protein [Polynucleobacter paneuropaeus]